jgi:ASCH domain
MRPGFFFLGKSKMRVLSVRQPWADWILSGRKRVEHRSWRTHVRGRILIHASGKHGAILGSVELVDVRKRGDRYDWILRNPQRFPQPIPAKGRLRFWNYFGL